MSTPSTPIKHPARYTPNILDKMREILPKTGIVLDPFAGTGLIHELATPERMTIGIEIEPEWATIHPRTLVGDAMALPLSDESVDVIATSPCLASDELVLRADLSWVPAGEIATGDSLIAFDEMPPGLTVSGNGMRRKWRIAEVTQAGLDYKECVRVTMENGDSVVCSFDHPWLANRYSHRTLASEWIKATDLVGSYVMKQLAPWEPRLDYRSGWLAGMFDGEGSLSFGIHGSPKLMMCQNRGPVADQAEAWLLDAGYKVNIIPRRNSEVVNLYICGGFPAVMQALGELRPVRLLDKILNLEWHSRTIQPDRVKVVSVEPVGLREIATLTTTTGTYIGAGYLHHNTYGNRFADSHTARDGSVRRSYTHDLGHKLHPHNSGQMQWGCVVPGTRVLTAALEWVPIETLHAGDGLIAFDEEVPQGTRNNMRRGRKWRTSTVEKVSIDWRECVRIVLEDGTTLTCTADHPFLVDRNKGRSSSGETIRRWRNAATLDPDDCLPRFLEPWETDNSRDAGWLAGMFDGEGWLSRPEGKLTNNVGIAQKAGPVLDEILVQLKARNFELAYSQGAAADSIRILGGLPEVARLLGLIRPVRLLPKFAVDGTYMRAINSVRVKSVRSVGYQQVVLMGTTTRTYVTEGFGSHNTQYRTFHMRAWDEAERVLKPGGMFILNCKNHIRKQEEQMVTEWHIHYIRSLEFEVDKFHLIPVKGMGFGTNGQSRVDHEVVAVLIKL